MISCSSTSQLSIKFFGLLILGMLTACQHTDPAVTRSQNAVDLLVGTRQSLISGETTVAESQAALRTLSQSTGDLRPQFDKFLVEVDAVRNQAMQMQHESEAVRLQAVNYCAARQKDISTISNDDMRQAAQLRTQHVKEKCDDIKDRYAAANASFTRYIRSLSDLQTYLGSELNFGTLDSGQKWIEEALSSGEKLRGDIRALALEIELTSSIISPVPVAVTQWSTDLVQSGALAQDR